MPRRQIAGAEAISAALDAGAAIALVLRSEPLETESARRLVERLNELGIPLLVESPREMRRMASSEPSPELLALEGPTPTRNLDELMACEGIVFVLVGLRYPSNVGFILRALEVAGGAGVVVDGDWGEAQFEEAYRIGMHAERFLPVLSASTDQALDAAERAGRRVVAVETSGETTPWEVDLASPSVVLVGSETLGIPDPIVARAHHRVRIPVEGFIPSYNVQAAVGIVLGEWMRQRGGAS